jgi:uncharacterized protein (DUF433 family)
VESVDISTGRSGAGRTLEDRAVGKGAEMTDDSRFTQPLYTMASAARLVGMPLSTFASWAKGYERRFPDRATVAKGPVITAVEPAYPGGPSIPFVGLVEAMVVQAFRRTDLPLQRIRRALAVLTDQGELAHALASRKLYTDGAEVLYDYATHEQDGQLRLLTVVDSGQRVFHEVIDAYLKRIHFDEDPWATEIVVPVTEREILRIRPEVASGDALFMHGGAPLAAVVSRYRAGERVESLADDYEVPVDDIREALRAIEATPVAA